MLQEHWLYQFQVDRIENIIPWKCFGRAVDHNNPLPPRGWVRGHGGTAITWKPELDHLITQEPVGNHRVIACTLKNSPKPVCLVCVYFPSGHSAKAHKEYKDTLDILEGITEQFASSHSIVIGTDLNHDLFNRRDPGRKRLLKFFSNNDLLVMSNGKNHTLYFSQHGTSCIDYFITNDMDLLQDPEAQVLDKVPENTSTHTPIVIQIKHNANNNASNKSQKANPLATTLSTNQNGSILTRMPTARR